MRECPDGEIGRRSGLKIRRPQGRGGSSPPLGTIIKRVHNWKGFRIQGAIVDQVTLGVALGFQAMRGLLRCIEVRMPKDAAKKLKEEIVKRRRS